MPLSMSDCTDDSQNGRASSAVGIACRLLNVPACTIHKYNPDGNNESAIVYFMSMGSSGENRLGFDLGPGDVLVAFPQSEINKFSWKLIIIPCKVEYHDAVYRDQLFRTRGETPTTVIQWSNGLSFRRTYN